MFAKSSLVLAATAAFLGASTASAQVTATGPMGPNNPAEPIENTPVNQTSMARLLSVNSVDDFCLFAPPEYGTDLKIGDTEAFEVAWCTKPRNNARVIPDGTIYAAHYVKTPAYVQISGWGDLTKLNIPQGDQGGELDPHGATGEGNPVGGNVTSNVSGSDVHYEEWMSFVSYQEFCIRICTSENSTYSAASMCQHELDTMGCNWVMPGNYDNNSFTSCEADAAYPPGVYPEPGGGFSTFAQRYTGSYTNQGTLAYWTIGQTVTPPAPASTPASSNCQTFSTISNGVASLPVFVSAGSTFSTPTGGSAATSAASGSSSGSNTGKAGAAVTSGASSSSRSGTAAASGASSGATSQSAAIAGVRFGTESYGTILSVGISAFAVIAGAGAFLL